MSATITTLVFSSVSLVSAMNCANGGLVSEGASTTRCYIGDQGSAYIEDQGDGTVQITTESDQGDVELGFNSIANAGDFVTLTQNGVTMVATLDEDYVTALSVNTDSGADAIYLQNAQGPVTVSNANSGVGSAADVIYTGAHDDLVQLDDTDGHVVYALEGNDYVYGYEGADTIYAGPGDDYVAAGAANDYVEGGAGEDDLRGGNGDDELYGGDDYDELRGSSGDDILMGQGGWDMLRGGSGFNMLHGGEGDDDLNGGESAICYSAATYIKCDTYIDSDSTDVDGDGFDWLEDCQDTDAWVGSGTAEDPANGIDDDCDGHYDEMEGSATYRTIQDDYACDFEGSWYAFSSQDCAGNHNFSDNWTDHLMGPGRSLDWTGFDNFEAGANTMGVDSNNSASTANSSAHDGCDGYSMGNIADGIEELTGLSHLESVMYSDVGMAIGKMHDDASTCWASEVLWKSCSDATCTSVTNGADQGILVLKIDDGTRNINASRHRNGIGDTLSASDLSGYSSMDIAGLDSSIGIMMAYAGEVLDIVNTADPVRALYTKLAIGKRSNDWAGVITAVVPNQEFSTAFDNAGYDAWLDKQGLGTNYADLTWGACFGGDDLGGAVSELQAAGLFTGLHAYAQGFKVITIKEWGLGTGFFFAYDIDNAGALPNLTNYTCSWD